MSRQPSFDSGAHLKPSPRGMRCHPRCPSVPDRTQLAINFAPHPSFRLLASTWDDGFRRSLKQHYTGSAGAPPGKKLVWAIYDGDDVRGYIGIGEPAYKAAPRRRLGLEDARPLEFTVCCFVYRLERDGPTKASVLLRDWHMVASHDWGMRYGWTPEHWETFVDPSKVKSKVPGACFRRAGYRSLGLTTGRSARRPEGHAHGPRVWEDAEPKLMLYRGPLARI